MRVDVISIFPQYFDALELSLLGRARSTGLLELTVHDLRDWTHDRHRTVDDTPYGGGAGMVMRPEPWGEALDAVIGDPADGVRLIVPTPSGAPFTQADAERLAREPRLVFAAGRYEGIDQRVVDHFGGRLPVEEVSVGDYVVNGGEAAVLVIVEAVARLLPGVLGNPESLSEESHAAGLLEYPVYTKPASWRGHDVPDVLLSGDHGRVAAWRREQSERRTVERRPDLLPGTALAGPDDIVLVPAVAADAAEVWTLQRACWVVEAQVNDALDIPPLVEGLDEVRAGLRDWSTWVARVDGRLVASGRGRLIGSTWHIGRLMVAPDLQGRGIGRALLGFVEAQAPAAADGFELLTGARSDRNIATYRKAGYRGHGPPDRGVVKMAKPRRR